MLGAAGAVRIASSDVARCLAHAEDAVLWRGPQWRAGQNNEPHDCKSGRAPCNSHDVPILPQEHASHQAKLAGFSRNTHTVCEFAASLAWSVVPPPATVSL